jgi:hypothetical protein
MLNMDKEDMGSEDVAGAYGSGLPEYDVGDAGE